MGGVGGASATSLARIATTTTIGVSPTSATMSQTVTFNATVTAASGAAPDGSVEFDATFTPQGSTTGSDIVLGTANLTAGTGTASTASLSLTGMQAGTYQVTGNYSPGGSITWSASSSPTSSLSVGAVLNQVTMSFSLSATTINAGQSVTFSTTITGPAGQPAPTGTVSFTAGSSTTDQSALPGGTVQLNGGVASAPIGGWSAGTFVVAANYQGDGNYASRSMTLTLTVNAVSSAVATTTAVTLVPTTIAAGGRLEIKAHVEQAGTHLAPPSGELVHISVGPVGGDPAQSIPIPGYQAVALDGSGNIDVTNVGGWAAGDWVVYVGYVGDVGNLPSTGSATLHVTQPSSGTAVSYTGDTAAAFGDTTTLSGELLDGSGNPISGATLTFLLAGSTCTGTTDGNGDASCDMAVSAAPGLRTVTVSFAGDTTYQAASKDTPYTVTVAPTTTSYTGATSGTTGQTVTLSAQLTSDVTSAGIANEPVTITMGAEHCTVSTDSNGNASCSVTIADATGTYPISATFSGDTNYAASSDSDSFTVAGTHATSTAAAPVTAQYGAVAVLSATLVDAATSTGVPGKSLTIVAGTQTCTTGATDANGQASCSITVNQVPGSYTLKASFAGDSSYTASNGTAAFTVQKAATTTTYTGATSGSKGSTVTLSAHLVDGAGNALSGKTLTIAIGTQSCTTGQTGATGNASCTLALNQAGGSYQVAATFAGDTNYATSTGTATFTISASTKPTTMKILPIAPVLKGSTVQLTGILFSGILPVGGRTVTLTLGTKSCTDVTNILGVAQCSVTATDPSGQAQAKAAFAGDATYQASFDTTSAIIYAFAPGGGTFVVGDRSDTGSVTFWGAQWSRSNALSGGSAPSSFKGFAVSPTTPQCGGTWSTDPGNSAPPPAGPLPAYMVVAVTSSTSKSGSKISGNVVALVLVKVDAGYQANPGHAGTGTVVATLCQSGNTKGGNGGGGDDHHGGGGGGDDDHHGSGGGGCSNYGF